MELTIQDLQNQLDDLKKRMAEVEPKAENRAAVGPRGPVGPPGLIGPKGEKGDSISGPQGFAGRDGRDGRDGETPSKDTLESIVATILTEYHVLDSDGLPYAGPYKK